MKRPIVLSLFLLAACGGGGTVSTPIPKAVTTASATFNVVIPQAVLKLPQYLSPSTHQFFIDLQDIKDPAFDHTLVVDSTHCTLDANNDQVCSWSVTEPVGKHVVSIAVGSANQGALGVGPPALLGYASHLTFDTATQSSLYTVLDALTGGNRGDDFIRLNYSDPNNGTAPGGVGVVPFVTVSIYDSGNNIIPWNTAANGPVTTTLLNPLTFTTIGETTGLIKLATLTRATSGGACVNSAAATSFTLNSLDGFCGLMIVDQLTGTQTSHFEVGFTNPAISVSDTEFPQIDTFPNAGAGPPTTWSANAFGEDVFVQCVAPAPGVQSCTQVNS